MHACLGDRDPVQCAVELPIPAAVEPVTTVIAAAGFERDDAGVSCDLASVSKRSIGPISPSSFAALSAPQPGSASNAGAVFSIRACNSRSRARIDRAGEAAAAADELACDLHEVGNDVPYGLIRDRTVRQCPRNSARTPKVR
jgi:hypothetical protein